MPDSTRPFEAYRGGEPYVFVSYAHADAATVYPDLSFLKEAGFNIWYDEGISPGSRWTSELADAIENCALFVAFLSPSAVASENCTNEIEFAVSRKRPLLVVHTAATEIPAGLELSLGGRQALLRYDLEASVYRSRLRDAVEKLIDGEDPHLVRSRNTPESAQRRPMFLALAVVFVAGLVYLATVFDRQTPDSDLRLAIAVRPFTTEIVGPDSGFFAEGIADDLVMRLGQWRTLPVISRGSSFAADLPANPVEAGVALNARFLVEGSVRSDSERIKLAVYLTDAANGRSVWSKEYEYGLDEAIARQAEIADAIVAEINPALISAEARRAVRADPVNLDAWSAAMRGWWHLNTETKEGLTEAQGWFTQAAELDPSWSWPHSALALSAYRSIINDWSADMRASVGSLVGSANKAVQLDPRDAFAHHALGHAYAIQGQIDQSIDALERGIELAPNDPMANGCYAMQLAASAQSAKALEFVGYAMAISPDDPWQHRFALVRARAHFAAADYADSEQWALRSLQLQPNPGAFLHSVAAPAMGDGLERAQQRTEEALAMQPLPPLAGIEQGFKRSTDPDYVARLLEGLRRAGFE